MLGAAAPARADESIGGAKAVVNLVTGDLAAGNKVSLVQGDNVFSNEGVHTDADSSARLILLDNTNLLLGASSSIKLDSFVYAGPKQPGAIAVSFVTGALRFATGDADKKAYVISTPTASLGVRGTVLKIISDQSTTFVLLDEGGALVCTRKGGAKKKCLTLTDPGQVVEVTEYDVRWAPEAEASITATIDAIASPSDGPPDGPPAGPPAGGGPPAGSPPASPPSHPSGNRGHGGS